MSAFLGHSILHGVWWEHPNTKLEKVTCTIANFVCCHPSLSVPCPNNLLCTTMYSLLFRHHHPHQGEHRCQSLSIVTLPHLWRSFIHRNPINHDSKHSRSLTCPQSSYPWNKSTLHSRLLNCRLLSLAKMNRWRILPQPSSLCRRHAQPMTSSPITMSLHNKVSHIRLLSWTLSQLMSTIRHEKKSSKTTWAKLRPAV